MRKVIILLLLGIIITWGFYHMAQSDQSNVVEVLRTSFGSFQEIPHPENIQTAGEWYFLEHVSSPLIQYHPETGSFSPLIAKSWEIDGSRYTIKLNPDARFHDGSPILSQDVKATLKRLLIHKTSTHFPLWEWIVGCENLTDFNENCSGIEIIDDHTLSIHLKERNESFFLLLVSPETGIWSKEDINPKTLKIYPKKFSGPYFVSQNTQDEFLLKKNNHSFIVKNHSSAPKKIQLKRLNRSETERQMLSQEIDIFISDYIPFDPNDWKNLNFGIHHTTPTTILYFYKLSQKSASISKDFLKAIWNETNDPLLYPANTFLPFAPEISLTEEEILSHFTEKSQSNPIRIAAPNVYFQEKLINMIVEKAKNVGLDLIIDRLPIKDYLAASTLENESKKYDYSLNMYVASERYPAVQLRFITEDWKPKIDLRRAEIPESTEEKNTLLRKYQQWLLNENIIIPLYFVRTQIIYQPNLDTGEQPITDGLIHLWKVQKRE